MTTDDKSEKTIVFQFVKLFIVFQPTVSQMRAQTPTQPKPMDPQIHLKVRPKPVVQLMPRLQTTRNLWLSPKVTQIALKLSQIKNALKKTNYQKIIKIQTTIQMMSTKLMLR